jgi:hypothetical protein
MEQHCGAKDFQSITSMWKFMGAVMALEDQLIGISERWDSSEMDILEQWDRRQLLIEQRSRGGLPPQTHIGGLERSFVDVKTQDKHQVKGPFCSTSSPSSYSFLLLHSLLLLFSLFLSRS